ncbi:MAG: GNAT family N-acetyltransferase [Ardenticatenaceae bacterium]
MRSFPIRTITKADESFLWEMLYYAAHMNEEHNMSVANAVNTPDLAKYVKEWGRPGDLGFIAMNGETKQPVGAVWVRIFAGTNKAYSQVDDQTPELAIAVLPEHLGQGIGTKLMQHLLMHAKGVYPAIALNVRSDNSALRLYQRLGFVVVSEMVNRVGGRSYDMRYNLVE